MATGNRNGISSTYTYLKQIEGLDTPQDPLDWITQGGKRTNVASKTKTDGGRKED